jgi:hypothetical protein
LRFWTAHVREGAAPLLVREGFSWGALIFGPLWLLAHRAWIPAALAIAGSVVIGAASAGETRTVLSIAYALLLGLSGNDMWRFSLERRGYRLADVVAARDADGAFARLLAGRPDLVDAIAMESLA